MANEKAYFQEKGGAKIPDPPTITLRRGWGKINCSFLQTSPQKSAIFNTLPNVSY
jgi:hypothetical protein